MATKKISELTDATSVGLSDEFAIVQGGTTKRATITELVSALGVSSSPTTIFETSWGALLPYNLGSATAPQALGMPLAATIDSSTVTGGAATTDGGGNNYSFRRRTRYQSAASAINRVAGFSCPAAVSPGRAGRWPAVCAGAISDASPTLGSFVLGLTQYPLTMTTVQPSDFINCVMVAADESDTYLQVMHNDGSGVCTKIDLGASFPRSQFVAYMVEIDDLEGDGSPISVTVTNLNSGATSTHSLTTNIPAVGTSCYQTIGRSSLSSVLQTTIDFVGFTLGKLPVSPSEVSSVPEPLVVAVGDETSALTTGTAKVTFRSPGARTVSAVRASLTTASSSGVVTVDVNPSGVTMLSTKVTVDASEKTSVTAATPAVISDSSWADDEEITIDVDTAGTDATGLKITFIFA